MHYFIERNSYTEMLEDLIDSEFDLVSVPVRVDKSASAWNCYANVEQKVRVSGGQIQYGWSVFQCDIMCEAQHHAVWQNDDGDLIDVTPNALHSDHILFIPDDRIVYKGKNIDSIRMNITQNAVVDDFISIAGLRELILANANKSIDNKLTFNSHTGMLYEKYQQLGRDILLFALAGCGPFSACFCNSGKVYQECHGLGLPEMITADKIHLPEPVTRLLTGSGG